MNYHFKKLLLLLVFYSSVSCIAVANSEEKVNDCTDRDYHKSMGDYVAEADCKKDYENRYSKYVENNLSKNQRGRGCWKCIAYGATY